MWVCTTEGICVEASSEFQGMQPPPPGTPVFQYRIRITNQGTRTVQLLGRQWEIMNNDGTQHGHVPRNSPGVVGQTPILRPGECFEYASGTTFSDRSGGWVQGSFQMVELIHEEKGKQGDPLAITGGSILTSMLNDSTAKCSPDLNLCIT